MKNREFLIAGIFALMTSLIFGLGIYGTWKLPDSYASILFWISAVPGILAGGPVAMAVSGNVHNFNTVILIVVSGFTNACAYYSILRLLFKRRRTPPADAHGK